MLRQYDCVRYNQDGRSYMNYIKHLHIEGFKKFSVFDIDFNEHMNILVGENEAGKSTILDAIKIVLNQQYRNADKAIFNDLFNNDAVSNFKSCPSIENLPSILIEIELSLDPQHKYRDYFYGEGYGERLGNQEDRFGIRFECKYDPELYGELEQAYHQYDTPPYEYYSLTWTTFANRQYQIVRRPLHFISIDTTTNSSVSSFNYYNRSLFISKYDEGTRLKAKNNFRMGIDKAFKDIELPPVSNNRIFGIDGKKVVLESIISVYEDSIALENRGSGMEALIKTQIALDRSNGLDVVLMEEPENHLCFSNMHKMLDEISSRQEEAQIIITTHNNMIASRLNINNVKWISENTAIALNEVDKKVADFFVKADDNAFLQLLLSKKIVLVEGATEYLLFPHFYKQETKRTVEEDGITIISCNGISYKNYLAIAKGTKKRIAVITDNDKQTERIVCAVDFNASNKEQHIFMGNSVEDWTWEACIYNANKIALEAIIPVQDNAAYLYHGTDYGKVLGKMLNDKVDTAYQMLMSEKPFELPQYVKEAIKWISV